MSPLWLEPGEGPDPAELRARVAWWEAREAALREQGEPELLGPARERPAEAQGRLDTFLPLATLRAELAGLLLRWFGPALEELGVDPARGVLGGARSWLEVRAWLPSLGESALPSQLVARLASARAAHDLLFELFCSSRWGAAFGRYPAQLARVVEASRGLGRRHLRVWDAGCATGEGTWELASALAQTAERVEALGTTPFALEQRMAERRARPHDPAATERLAAFLATAPLDRIDVSFARGALPAERPAGSWDVVACHGVLGEAIAEPGDQRRALETLAGALAPGGLLSLSDRFREDRSAAARRLAQESASRLGLREVSAGLYAAE